MALGPSPVCKGQGNYAESRGGNERRIGRVVSTPQPFLAEEIVIFSELNFREYIFFLNHVVLRNLI